jgi:hypothetical protein
VLGDEPRALDDLREVTPREPLALGHHAEAVRPGRLGGARVLQDLLRLQHRVHRGIGLCVPRLGAEAAVLGASARLRVDERAHIGRVREALAPDLPGALDEVPDPLAIGHLAELERLVEADQGWHAAGG